MRGYGEGMRELRKRCESVGIGERKAKEVRPNTPHHTAGIRNGSGQSERTIFAGTVRAGSECLLYSHREPLTDPLYRMMRDDTESYG